ncbi:50S ribosomal protein L24e [Candidatus Bathyarchaeota archaeon]|nr:50S ribosomal protein L24e [Candidatus Bathyarchaeota archaeon]
MPRSRPCSFCGYEYPQSYGRLYIRNDGTALWFCSSKCRKNSLTLKRDSRKLRWTKYYGKEERGRA